MSTGIVEQLTEYCSCIKDASEENIEELINIISMATCWMKEPCDTFLAGQRTEVILLPSCMDCPMEFKPFYHPFDADSFTFSLVKVDGIKETITSIEDYAYSAVSDVFRINTGLPSCKCNPCDPCSDCEVEYKLLVSYTAGYELIPECLLPVFCNVLEVIAAKNDCSCDDCACEGSKYEDNVQYAEGDVVTVALETDLGQLLVEQYKKQLQMISLCKPSPELWGFVV